MDSIDNEKTLIRGDRAGGYALAAGQMLGQFRVLRGLGRGGMGEVGKISISNNQYSMSNIQVKIK